MARTKAITLRLDPSDYDRLEAEAERIGVRAGTLARVYVRAGLEGGAETDTQRRHRAGLDALTTLARLAVGLSPIDAVEVARQSREELARRP